MSAQEFSIWIERKGVGLDSSISELFTAGSIESDEAELLFPSQTSAFWSSRKQVWMGTRLMKPGVPFALNWGSASVHRGSFPTFQAQKFELAEPGCYGADDALVLPRRSSDWRRRAVLSPPRRRKGRVDHLGR